MKILIYGGGAVGLGLAAILIRADIDVTIVARTNTVEALGRDGLFLDGLFGEFHAQPTRFEAYDALDACPALSFDYVLVCTKSYDTEHAATDLAQHRVGLGLITSSTKIISVQNGWGNSETLARHFNKEAIGCARVITGFTRPHHNRVTVTVHADAMHAGSLFGEFELKTLEPLCSAIARGGFDCMTVGNIGEDLWAKMLYNCALNPLGAIFQASYGELAEKNESREIMNTTINEIYSMMDLRGYASHWKTASEYRDVFYDRLVPPTAAHESSMLQDIRAGKRTEIDALNGAVVRMASDSELIVPTNIMLVRMIKFIEARSQKPR